MQTFTLTGQELFDSFPEPVFWTCLGRLTYWNHAAEQLCREAGTPLERNGELPGPLQLLDGKEEQAADLRLAGRVFHGLGQPLSEGRLFLLRPAEAEAVLSGRRLSLLMERMRGPMSNLYTAMQMLSEPADSQTVEIMLRNFYRLLRMMNEVEFSRRLADQTGGEFSPVTLDFAGLCREVVRQTEPLAERYGRRLVYETEESSLLVLGESALLEQMLYQLISNAWRASGQEGLITMRLSRQQDRAVLTVTDQGGGMSGTELASAFNPDAGGEELTDVEAGLGLGIPISRYITQLHRGSLILENRAGQGMSATVSLPVSRGSSRPLRAPAPRAHLENGISRVLLELSDVLPHRAFRLCELE